MIGVTWRSFALGATLIAVALSAALVAAVATGVDALATVALVVAILAFLIQIVVFIAQTWTSAQLHSSTERLLEGIRTRTEESASLLHENYGQLLAAYVEGQRAAALNWKSSGHPDAQAGEAQRIVEKLGTGTALLEQAKIALEPSPGDAAIIARLTTFPEDRDAEPMMARLEHMSPFALTRFVDYAQDELRSRLAGVEPGFYVYEDPPFSTELARAGLISIVERKPTEVPYYGEGVLLRRYAALTPTGSEVARLFLGRGRSPQYMVTWGNVRRIGLNAGDATAQQAG